MSLASTATVAASVALAQLVAGCCGCPSPKAAAPEAAALTAATPSAVLAANLAAGVVAVKTCPAALVPAADGLIDDLEDNDNQVGLIAGRGGYWWAAKDDKGSSIEPFGDMKISAGGAGGSKFAVHVSGKTATGEGAWGAVFGLRVAQAGLYDASKYAGVSFFAKAGEKSEAAVRLNIADVNTHPDGKVCKDACYNDFGKDFNFSHDWQEYKATFAELKQQDGWGDPRPPSITPAELVQIAWHVTTPGADFDLWIDDVRFLDCQ